MRDASSRQIGQREIVIDPMFCLCSNLQASTFKRPPKPLPRTRPPKPEKPPTPANPVCTDHTKDHISACWTDSFLCYCCALNSLLCLFWTVFRLNLNQLCQKPFLNQPSDRSQNQLPASNQKLWYAARCWNVTQLASLISLGNDMFVDVALMRMNWWTV